MQFGHRCKIYYFRVFQKIICTVYASLLYLSAPKHRRHVEFFRGVTTSLQRTCYQKHIKRPLRKNHRKSDEVSPLYSTLCLNFQCNFPLLKFFKLRLTLFKTCLVLVPFFGARTLEREKEYLFTGKFSSIFNLCYSYTHFFYTRNVRHSVVLHLAMF